MTKHALSFNRIIVIVGIMLTNPLLVSGQHFEPVYEAPVAYEPNGRQLSTVMTVKFLERVAEIEPGDQIVKLNDIVPTISDLLLAPGDKEF